MYTCLACGWRGDDHDVEWRVSTADKPNWASSYCPDCGHLIDSEDDETSEKGDGDGE